MGAPGSGRGLRQAGQRVGERREAGGREGEEGGRERKGEEAHLFLLIQLIHELVEFQLAPHHTVAPLVHPVVGSW